MSNVTTMLLCLLIDYSTNGMDADGSLVPRTRQGQKVLFPFINSTV